MRVQSFAVAFPSPLLLPPPRTPRLPIRLCRRKKRKAAHQAWLVPDAGVAQKWATAINDSLKGRGLEGEGKDAGEDGVGVDIGQGTRRLERQRRRRLLVLINPVSGTGGSRSIWNNTLRSVVLCYVDGDW